MTDPIGVVGTAVGIVSFGLQLYSAVATYVDALDGRKDDLASARAQLDSLRDSLTTIQSALPSSPSASTGTSTVPPIVTECKKELDQLEILLQDLVGSNTSGNKLKERIKTLKFPFRRDSLVKLEDRLHKTNSVFQTTLSVLNLNKSIDNERRFSNLETVTAQVPAINANVVQISTDVQDLRVDVGNMSTNINSAISRMNPDNNEVLSRLDLSVTQLTATAGQILPQISNRIASIEQRMLEERLGTLSLLEHALGIQNGQRLANPQLALRRLLSKPSQTREIYDSISNSTSMTTHHDSSHDTVYDWFNTGVRRQSCSCMYRNDRRGTIQSFKSLWLRTESIRHEHNQDCGLSKLGLSKSRHKFELTTTRPFSFWPWSLQISFALTTGAGGFSISPNITFRPIVDEKRSPVFRILENLLFFWKNGSYTRAELSASLSATKNTILELYSQKKAFANEVAEYNNSRETAISRMISILIRYPASLPSVDQDLRNHQTPVAAFSDMIVELVQAGLPADDYDYSGRNLATRLAFSEVHLQTKRLLPVLFEAGPDPVRGLDGSEPGRGDLRYYTEPYDSSLKNVIICIHAEIFCWGPLSAAIMAQKDERHIQDLITANNVSEVNVFGQTPLHLAAGTGKAKVLSALLRVKGTHDILHARDTNRYHAIDYTAIYSGVSCREGTNPVFCSDCCCTLALDALLCAEGFFDSYLNDQRRQDYFAHQIYRASYSWKLRFFTEIKLRRDELKQLALPQLEVVDIRRYKLDGDGVLDHHGTEVIERLTEMGIEVPARIQNSFFDPERGPSIYRMLPELSKHDNQLFFDLGFRDIDELDELGHTPLMVLSTDNDARAGSILWFVKQGVDVTRTAPSIGLNHHHSYPTIAHLVAQKLGSPYSDYAPEAAYFMSKIAPISTADGCECYCTENGCTPASILSSRLARRSIWEHDYAGDRSRRYWEEQTKVTIPGMPYLAKFFGNDNVNLAFHRHACLAALRVLTFEALGIRHTCGCRDENFDMHMGFHMTSMSREDIEDIWEEDANLIGKLNELQPEFETLFDSSGMSFVVFLVEKWLPRMDHVIQELDEVQLSEAERRDAESVGVKWDTHGTQFYLQPGMRLITVSPRYHIIEWDCPYPSTLQEYLRATRKIAEE